MKNAIIFCMREGVEIPYCMYQACPVFAYTENRMQNIVVVPSVGSMLFFRSNVARAAVAAASPIAAPTKRKCTWLMNTPYSRMDAFCHSTSCVNPVGSTLRNPDTGIINNDANTKVCNKQNDVRRVETIFFTSDINIVKSSSVNPLKKIGTKVQPVPRAICENPVLGQIGCRNIPNHPAADDRAVIGYGGVRRNGCRKVIGALVIANYMLP